MARPRSDRPGSSGPKRRPTGARSGPSSGPPKRELRSKPPAKPRDTKESKPTDEPSKGAERLHKILAQAGVGSRRACELLILEGRVTVDGTVIRELGTKVDPAAAKIAVDGQRIRPEAHVYYLVYKPKGYVSTSEDPSGRPLVLDLVPRARERIFIVGRLDRHSEGLMLLTNDGALAQRLTHPSYGVEKTYRVTVSGDAGQEIVNKLTEGVWLAEGKVRARRARIVAKRGNVTVLEVVLAEGKNREIRRMLARLEHKVLSLLRVAIGPLQLKGLSEGDWRALSASEVDRLRNTTSAEDTDQADHRPARKPFARPAARSGDSESPGRKRFKSTGGENDRRPSGFGRDQDRFSKRRPGPGSGPARPDRRRRDEPATVGDDEEIVFTDRMDIEDRAPRDTRPARDSRPPRPNSRRESATDRGDRSRSGVRSDRNRTGDRDDRPRSSDRSDRPRSYGRDARPARSNDRGDRPVRTGDRDDRPRSSDRSDRPRSYGRDDRPARSNDRGDRPVRTGDREDRPRSSDRSDRPRSYGRDDRPARSNDRGDRPVRTGDRDDRPRSSDRGDRPAPRPGGKFAGKGRSDGPRDNRSGENRRTVMGQPNDSGRPAGPPKRRGGPSRGLPPRRRRPKPD